MTSHQKGELFKWDSIYPVSVWDKYSNIQIYSNIFGQIYSLVLIFIDFFQAKYIRIFICDLFILTNIFGYVSEILDWGPNWISHSNSLTGTVATK